MDPIKSKLLALNTTPDKSQVYHSDFDWSRGTSYVSAALAISLSLLGNIYAHRYLTDITMTVAMEQ